MTRYSTPRVAHWPMAVTITPLGFDVLVEPSNQLIYTGQRSKISSFGPRPIHLVLRSHVPRPWVYCQQPTCVRPHAVGICFFTCRRAHVRALLPVRGVKPREYGSDTPVTTRPGITDLLYTLSKSHMLNNSLTLSSSLRAKGSNRSY